MVIAAATGVLPLDAANWYVDNAASGANNGTSWANAWQDFSNIVWSSVSPGDTVFLSGGTTSKYYQAWPDRNGNRRWAIKKAGTSSSPITFRLGQDAGHNGVIWFSNYIYLSQECTNLVFDFGRSPTFNASGINPLSPWSITNNIGLYIHTPALTRGILCEANYGVKFRWLDIRAGSTNALGPNVNNVNGIDWSVGINPALGYRDRKNCEVAYCYIHHCTCDGFHEDGASPSSGLGGLKIHHCIILQNADDAFEGGSGVDFSYNLLGDANEVLAIQVQDTQAHPDGIQAPGFNLRIYNNVFIASTNSATYLVPLADYYYLHGGNIFQYGNLAYSPVTDRVCDLLNLYPRCSQDPANYYSTNFTMRWTNVVFANNTTANSLAAARGVKWGTFAIDRVSTLTNCAYQTLSNSWILNNVIWRVCQGLTGNAALAALAPCDVDYNTLDDVGGAGSKRISLGTNTLHYTVERDPTDLNTWNTPELFNAARAQVSNITATVTLVSTNPGAFDFRLAATDTGAKNRGLDLSTYLPASVLALMPDYDKDLTGQLRGGDGAWDRGALEYTPATPADPLTNGLLLWLTFEDDFSDGRVNDQSGNNRHMLRYSFTANPTNWPTRVPHTNSTGYAAQFQPYYTIYYPTGQTQYYLGDYGAITNLGELHDPGLTDFTLSVWVCYYGAAGLGYDQNSSVINASYAQDGDPLQGGWQLGRDYSMATYGTYFTVWTNRPYGYGAGGLPNIVWVRFPDDYSGSTPVHWSGGYHHYLVTADCANHVMKAYFQGTHCWTTALPDHITTIRVPDINYGPPNGFPWIALGTDPHYATATLDDQPYQPNSRWFHGGIDDLRIYDRVLSAAEIAALFSLERSGNGGGVPLPPARAYKPTPP